MFLSLAICITSLQGAVVSVLNVPHLWLPVFQIYPFWFWPYAAALLLLPYIFCGRPAVIDSITLSNPLPFRLKYMSLSSCSAIKWLRRLKKHFHNIRGQTYEWQEIALNNTNKRHCSLSRRRVLKLMPFCMLGWARIQQQQQVKWNWTPFTDGEWKQTAVFSTHGYIKRLQCSGLESRDRCDVLWPR